jgi:hypothetical protein
MERFNKGEKSYYNEENARISKKKRAYFLFEKNNSIQDKDNINKNEILKSKKTHFNIKSTMIDTSKNSSLRPLFESKKENNIDFNNEPNKNEKV